MQPNRVAEETTLVGRGAHQMLCIAQLGSQRQTGFPCLAAVESLVEHVNDFFLDGDHVVKALLPRCAQLARDKHTGGVHHVAAMGVNQIHQHRVAFLDPSEARPHAAQRMRARSTNGGIEERRNASGAPGHDDATVALQGIAAHLHVAAKAFTAADGFGGRHHVEFAHAFAANGLHRLKHPNLNRCADVHLFEFPGRLDFPLAVNHGRGIAAFAQRRQGRSKSGGEGAGGFAELERRSPVHAFGLEVFGEGGETGKGLDEVRGIIATGFPNGPLERATNKGDGAITAGLLAATGTLGGDEK